MGLTAAFLATPCYRLPDWSQAGQSARPKMIGVCGLEVRAHVESEFTLGSAFQAAVVYQEMISRIHWHIYIGEGPIE